MNREQRRKAKKQKSSAPAVPEPKVYYTCDPHKNTECKKTNCHINGGPCECTTRLEFAMQPVERVRLILPVEADLAKEIGLEVE